MYLSVALVYTTNYILVLPISSFVSHFFGTKIKSVIRVESRTIAPPVPRVDLVTQAWKASHVRHMDDADVKASSLWSFPNFKDQLYLAEPHTFGLSKDRKAIHEAVFISKAFSQSLHPTKIIPFYYNASVSPDENDVTITTLVTSNRYKVLRQLVDRYQGIFPSTDHHYSLIHF